MHQWKTLNKELVLDLGRFLKVEKHTIQLPDGKILYDWPWVVSPDYVLVLPVTKNKNLLLFRQTKYAVEGISLAPVGGYLEPGENALTAAMRELKEETGCEAAEWIRLGSCPNNGNHGGGSGNLFLALNARKVREPIIDDLEEMELVELTIDEAEKKLMEGEVKVMGWMTMIAMGLLYLKNS